MFAQSHIFPAPISSSSSRRRWRAMAVAIKAEGSEGSKGKKANLIAKRKERIKLPRYSDGRGRSYSIREFLAHQSGVESLLNTGPAKF